MNAIERFFSLPSLPNQAEQQVARMLRIILLFFSGVSLLYGVLNTLTDTVHWPRYALQSGFLLLSMLLGMALLRKGRLRAVALLVTLSVWLVFTIAAYTGGGVRSSGYLGYIVVLVVAGILSGRRLDTLLVALLCLGAGYFMVYADGHGLLPAPRVPITPFAFWIDSVVYFTVVAGLLLLTIRVSVDALHNLNHELAERQRIEGALRESEGRYRALLENIPAVTYLLDAREGMGHQVIYISPQIQNMLGYAQKDFEDPGFWNSVIYAEDREHTLAASLRAGLTGGPFAGDYRVIAADGRLVWLRDESVLVRDEQGQPLYRLGFWSDITDRKLAEEKAAQTASQMAMLNEIGRAVSEVTDLPTVLEVIRQKLEKLVEFDFYSVRIFNIERQTVTHLAIYENGRYWREPDTPLFPESGISKVLETGKSVLYLRTPAETEAYRANPYMQIGDHSSVSTSLIFVPLKKQGQTIGALSVQRRELNSYTEEHLHLVEAVAVQVAIAIENARLFARLQNELAERSQAEELTRKVNFELQRRIKELYALNAVAQAGASAKDERELLELAIETLYKFLYTDVVGIALWNEAEEELYTYPYLQRGLYDGNDAMKTKIGVGIVGRVAATRQPYRMREAKDDPVYLAVVPSIRSEVCVPILAGDKLLGVLNAESRQPDAFSDSDESLLITMAGQLASALKRLRAEQQLRALNVDLEQRVMDRTAQLEAANKELESFSYSVSHDLRAPLRSINGFANILGNDFSQELTPLARGFLNKIVLAGSQMSQLIDGLLDFSRLGRKPLNLQPIDINELVRSVIEALSDEVKDRQVAWKLTEMPPVTADPTLLRLVYVNLIDNAIKYTNKRPSAQIEIGSFEQAGATVYYVRDDGAGFNMEYADKLFGVFQRLHRDDEFEGTGIGLATVRRVIERHGGRVWAEAKAGQGATFFFMIGKAG